MSAMPTQPVPTPAALVARTVEIADPTGGHPAGLLALLPPSSDPTEPCSWVRRGEGLVGWGAAASLHARGADRFADADAWWRHTVEATVVRDEVGMPGSGLVCFGSLPFAPDSADQAAFVVPHVTVGHRGKRWWVTTVGPDEIGALAPHPTTAPEPPADVTFADGALSPAAWETRVAEAVHRITAGELDKVVLARDLLVSADGPIDPRWVLQALAERYPSTWVFAVEGMLGATPELLVRRERGLVTSRILAGTIRRTGDDAKDLSLAASLARSSKDLEEHEYAVRSVADSLAPHCFSMNVPDAPFVLHLPNVMHLATDVTGVASDGVSSLALAAALHPSAAVGGTPTSDALAVIAELEGMDRGRYAGPIGWMDASGDGEWGIALRSGCYLPGRRDQLRIFAGCGIVAGSDPEAEVAESDAKLVPMRDALSGR
ncbi:MAG TPA: isochorismate synthase [Dermatophilaceae bacterium]|nr:isochorismate synthase [Dermatophilaceae bacterium]